MHAEYFLVNDRRDRQTVKTVCEGFPQLDVVATFALIVKPVDSVDRCTFMVSSENEKVLRVLNLVSEQQTDRLQTLLASVDVISQEQIVCVRGEPTKTTQVSWLQDFQTENILTYPPYSNSLRRS